MIEVKENSVYSNEQLKISGKPQNWTLFFEMLQRLNSLFSNLNSCLQVDKRNTGNSLIMPLQLMCPHRHYHLAAV